MAIKITSTVSLDESELIFTFIRAAGPGGQNVNKVATAVQLRFNLLASPSLPPELRIRLSTLLASRLTRDGTLIIKANRFRTQERNKQDALLRLTETLQKAAIPIKKRKKTRPTYAAKQKRLEKKKLHGKTKALRGKRMADE